MTNIAKTINDYLKENIPGIKTSFDLFPDDKFEGVIIVHDPSTKKSQRFIDGSSINQINLSFTGRFKNASNCREILTNVLDLLDNKKLMDTSDSIELKISDGANVQFIGCDDKGSAIYTCSVNVEYWENKNKRN